MNHLPAEQTGAPHLVAGRLREQQTRAGTHNPGCSRGAVHATAGPAELGSRREGSSARGAAFTTRRLARTWAVHKCARDKRPPMRWPAGRAMIAI